MVHGGTPSERMGRKALELLYIREQSATEAGRKASTTYSYKMCVNRFFYLGDSYEDYKSKI